MWISFCSLVWRTEILQNITINRRNCLLLICDAGWERNVMRRLRFGVGDCRNEWWSLISGELRSSTDPDMKTGITRVGSKVLCEKRWEIKPSLKLHSYTKYLPHICASHYQGVSSSSLNAMVNVVRLASAQRPAQPSQSTVHADWLNTQITARWTLDRAMQNFISAAAFKWPKCLRCYGKEVIIYNILYLSSRPRLNKLSKSQYVAHVSKLSMSQ